MITEKEAVEIFEKIHSLHELLDMESDIQGIDRVLSQKSINMSQVRTQIDTINRKHPENVILFNLIFPPQGKRVLLAEAPAQGLIDDLTWKQTYLQAKKAGKTIEDFCKEMQKI